MEAPPSSVVVRSAAEMIVFPGAITRAGLQILYVVRDGAVYVGFGSNRKFPRVFNLSKAKDKKEPYKGVWLPLHQALALPGFQRVEFQRDGRALIHYTDGKRQAINNGWGWSAAINTAEAYAREKEEERSAATLYEPDVLAVIESFLASPHRKDFGASSS